MLTAQGAIHKYDTGQAQEQRQVTQDEGINARDLFPCVEQQEIGGMLGGGCPLDDLLGRTHRLPDRPDFIVVEVEVVDADGAAGGDEQDRERENPEMAG